MVDSEGEIFDVLYEPAPSLLEIQEIKKITIEATISMMEGFNTPPDIISQQIEELENTEQFSIVNSLKSIAFQAVFQIKILSSLCFVQLFFHSPFLMIGLLHSCVIKPILQKL